MIPFLRFLAALVLIGVIVLLGIIFIPPRLTPAAPVQAGWTPSEGAGLYATRMADCAACHTAPDGKPFAGGRAIESPVGVIYSPNITPDPQTGIGNWTLDQFRAALVDGIAPGGRHLYPAMPYVNYRHMAETDIRAIYDYMQTSVAPVEIAAPATRLPFPFNQRWGIRLWNWAALAKPGFRPDAAVVGDDPLLQRGAYLVQVMGHCGACHTPRNRIFQQDGRTAADPLFLAGGEIAGWGAPTLRGPNGAPVRWSAGALRDFLVSGRNAHAGVGGEMKLAIAHSLQYLTPGDADAIVAYLRALPGLPGGGAPGPALPNPPAGNAEVVTRVAADANATTIRLREGRDLTTGERLYMDNCAACHFPDGLGANGVFPQLVGNTLVVSDHAEGLLHTILAGAALPSTIARPEALRMPPFADRLNDAEVAELATFLRSAWGNAAAPIDAPRVAETRSNVTAEVE